MMKSLFNKSLSKNFSIVKRYIRPKNSQEYYDKHALSRATDKQKTAQQKASHNVYPLNVQFPDSKGEDFYDDKNQHYLYHFQRWRKEIDDRMGKHLEYASASSKSKKFSRLFSLKVESTDIDSAVDDDMPIDPTTGLMYGVGFDDYIKKRIKTLEKKESDAVLDELVTKLGYVDLRDFVALNKYVLEAKNHTDNVNRTKARLLSIAMDILNQTKNAEVSKIYKEIDANYKTTALRNEKKLEYLLENVEEAKTFFYQYYYKIKERNDKEDEQTLDAFEKYEKIIQQKRDRYKEIDNSHNRMSNEKNNDKNQVTDYMDYLIKQYRNQRTLIFDKTTHEIQHQVRQIMSLEVTSENKKHITKALNNCLTLIKYYSFFQKHRKVYTPTNTETERLINKFQKEKKLRQYTRESTMKNDDFLEPLIDSEADPLKNNAIFKDQKDAELSKELEAIKNTYFDMKYNYEKSKLADKIDQELIDDLGYVVTAEMINDNNNYPDLEQVHRYNPKKFGRIPRKNKFSFMEKLVDDHYKSFKVDYMYSYLDYFSNKHRVRRRIGEEMKRKVSIPEINALLNKLVEGHNKDAKPSEKKKNSDRFLNMLKTEYGSVTPDFIERTLHKDVENLVDLEKKITVETEVEKVSKRSIVLNEKDFYEVELYKGIKNDPLYRHYLYTHLAYFAETSNDMTLSLPYSVKGIKPKDYIRWEKLKPVNMDKIRKKSYIEPEHIDDSLIQSPSSDFPTRSENPNSNGPAPDTVFRGFGKRKRCKAYAEVTQGNGAIIINGKPIHRYFTNTPMRHKILIPLRLTNNCGNLNIKLTLLGGGFTGQLDASIPAISKALVQMNPQLRQVLAKNLCLKHDPRNVEPKKPGRIKARKGYVYNRR